MLDVHAVHGAVRSWRDFFVHIVIIAIGLGLAISLQQTVEYLHHRHQVAETRHALAQERAENRRTFASQTRYWRRTVAELQNNLLVFQYLQQHPGTAQENLPGVLIWRSDTLSFSTAAWDAARQGGVIALMPRKEIEYYSGLYDFLAREWDFAYAATLAVVEATRYDLIDANPSHLGPAQIAAEIELVQTALGKEWLLGAEMSNLVREYPDFPPTVTRVEMDRLRHAPDEETLRQLRAAHTLTMERLKAAGDLDESDTAGPTPPPR
jgi:hypothetical protein